MLENMLLAEDSMIVGPLSGFSGWEERSLIRSNTVGNTMFMDKTFSKYIDQGIIEALLIGKANP